MCDKVNSPKHYSFYKNIEAIDIIKAFLESESAKDLSKFDAYCVGNILKYRLRAGGKDEVEQEIAKANKYREIGESL